jgi:hypothetical protein
MSIDFDKMFNKWVVYHSIDVGISSAYWFDTQEEAFRFAGIDVQDVQLRKQGDL